MSRRGYAVFWAFLLLIFSSVQVAWGQAKTNGDSSDSARERVHQLIVTRIATELNLNPEETAKLGTVLKKYKQNKHRLRYEIQNLTAQLRKDTESGNEKATQATLKQLQAAQDQLDRSDEIMFAEVKAMLTPNQVAQFVLVMDEIRHEVRAVKRRGRPNYEGGPSYQFKAPNTQQAPQQPQLTNQPVYQPGYPPGYGSGYVNPYRPGVQVSD